MTGSRWVRVSAASPCPVCGKPDWCSVSADGATARCMRVEAGSFKSKEDRNGNRCFLHRLADARSPGASPPPAGPAARRADADTLHEVYSALLARLALSKSHREGLQQRGLADEEIDRRGYRSLPVQGRARVARELRETFGDRVLRVPGIVVKEGPRGRYLTVGGAAGLLVPVRDRAGKIVALKTRRDDIENGANRYGYLSSAGRGGPGPGSPVHLPLGTPEKAEVVRLTEGELKADVIQLRTGLPTLSIPGVGSWRAALPVLQSLGCRTVRLAFDMDAWDKPAVARSLSACAGALAEADLAVELERWDATGGKGLDDLLASGGTAEVLQGDAASQAVRDILDAATVGDEPGMPDELARLQDVLDGGGAEALFRDRALMQALADMAGNDPSGFAAVRASIRGLVSPRDLNTALRGFRQPPGGGGSAGSPLYFEESGCIHRNVQTKDGPVAIPLCNFTARIVEDLVHDDGAEQKRSLAVEGALANGSPLPRAEVQAADFGSMNWVIEAWGTRAVVYAGQGTKDHLRAALQLSSGGVPRRTIYAHLGWRKVEDAWVYLHAGGAIGAAGAVDVAVSLPGPLAGFSLPAPPAGPIPRAGALWDAADWDAVSPADAVRASLGLLRLGPDRLTFPVLAAVYRSVLGETDFGVHLSGPTGSFKSEAAALAQQHFGAGMDARHLPASWSSTGNALEGMAFVCKDALLVVDDFAPTGSTADVQRYHREADRLFRGQGNRAGRQRMRADASLRPPKPPRGLVLSTGEDVPRNQSVRARMLVLEVSPGDLGPQPPEPNPALSACQAEAAAGKYALALAGFIRWLAPRYDAVRAGLRAEAAQLREQARTAGQHARTPGIAADLALGLRYLLEFARDCGAINDNERAELWRRGWQALGEAAAAQAAHIGNTEPAGLFVRLLSAALASGYAHVADPAGNAPPEPQRWGWRPEEFYTGDGTDTRFKPQGVRLGWLDGNELFLEPEASYTAVQRFARDQGESFAITPHTLRRRLKEKGLLAATDAGRGKLTVRKTVQGERRDVLHLARPGDLLSTPETGPTGPEDGSAGDGGPVSRAGNGQGPAESAHAPPHVPALRAAQELVFPDGKPEMGRLGRPGTGGDESRGDNHSDGQPGDGWGDWQ